MPEELTNPFPDDDKIEEWRQIEDFPAYAVSSLGRIKRLTTRCSTWAGRILKPGKCGPYFGVTLCRGPERKTVSVHSMVATAFLGKRPDHLECHHKDGNPLNNRIDNLEYVTPSENNRLAYVLGKHKPQLGSKANLSKLTEEDVLRIIELRKKRLSCTRIASMFPVNLMQIYNIISGRRWSHLTKIDPSEDPLKRGKIKVKFIEMELVCEICGKSYIAHKSNRKTCSKRCQRRREYLKQRPSKTWADLGTIAQARLYPENTFSGAGAANTVSPAMSAL